MSDLAELERRISAALDRIARRADMSQSVSQPASQPVSSGSSAASGPAGAGGGGDAGAVLAALRAELSAEQSTNAQLTERVHQLKQRQDNTISQLERSMARLTEQLDLQSLELLRLKKANAKLVSANAALRDTQAAGYPEGQVMNRSLSAELEALQAERRVEIAEMEEILAELKPLLSAEASHAG
ncbi:hypothetical protein [Roseicitreum antarcticum]|jgi:hypothetical protein|uniref:Uncharacterized protein n=1 Tax=Roseicitreum antarcticum TaxID=564137 RepID=A0A1H2XWQ4_9RHOB|nr:hypothetical protein [Roseicitreum antarcticum]SDW97165.1 hypothetical protein SAMN04488238_104334 [Roseicitreum antarcticum]